MVHQGFLDLYQGIQGQLLQIMLAISDTTNTIVISGHSLGAAIASIFALKLKTMFPAKTILCYTFGKPRVGNIQYAQCVNQALPGSFWRLENEDDMVPTIQLSTNPNPKSPSEPFVYQHEGQVTRYSLNYEGLGLSHYMINYFDYFWGVNS